jgi:hypothetical protein
VPVVLHFCCCFCFVPHYTSGARNPGTVPSVQAVYDLSNRRCIAAPVHGDIIDQELSQRADQRQFQNEEE